MAKMMTTAVPKGQAEAPSLVSHWLEGAKASGLVRRAFDAHDWQLEAVAP